MDVFLASVHWLYTLALALWAGSLTMLLVVLRGRRARPEDVEMLERARRRAHLAALWSVVVLLLALVADVGANAWAAGAGPFDGTTLRSLLFESRYGATSVARWLLLLASLWTTGELRRAPLVGGAPARRASRQALGIVAPAFRPRPAALTRDPWSRLTAMLALGVLLCTAAATPYGATPLGGAVETLHLAATMLWLGGALAIAVTVAPYISLVERARRSMAVLTVLNRFTPIALMSLIILMTTGLWETAFVGESGMQSQGDRATALLTLARLALFTKALLLGGIVIVSAYSLLGPRRRLQWLALRSRRDTRLVAARDRMLRLVRRALVVNAVLALLALACGGVADLYPRQVAVTGANTRQALTVASHAGATTVLLHVTPNGRHGTSADIDLTDAQGRPISGTPVGVSVASLATRGLTFPSATASGLGAGRYRAQLPPLLGGRWRIGVTVGSGARAATAFFTLTVPASTPPKAQQNTATKPTTTPRGERIRQGWQELGPVLITHALVVAPANPITDMALLYEGTIEGVYLSKDGGAHWTAASNGLPDAAREVWSLTLLPDRSLVAATGGGLYRSTDGARRWRSIGLSDHAIYTLATHVAGHIMLLAGGDGGIYRSDDLGAHWRRIYDTGAASVTSLAWPALHPSLVVAGVNPGYTARGARQVLTSNDGGASWSVQARGLPQTASIMSVAVAPGARVMYTGTLDAGAYATHVAPGASWQGRGVGLPAKTQVGAFAFVPTDPSRLYAATSSGVYKSRDGGARWQPFGAALPGDASVVNAVTLTAGPQPALYAATAAGLYRWAP